jgi:hypothetical protein
LFEGEINYFGDKVDIFAIGVIVFIMIAGNIPFNKATDKDGIY